MVPSQSLKFSETYANKNYIFIGKVNYKKYTDKISQPLFWGVRKSITKTTGLAKRKTKPKSQNGMSSDDIPCYLISVIKHFQVWWDFIKKLIFLETLNVKKEFLGTDKIPWILIFSSKIPRQKKIHRLFPSFPLLQTPSETESSSYSRYLFKNTQNKTIEINAWSELRWEKCW